MTRDDDETPVGGIRRDPLPRRALPHYRTREAAGRTSPGVPSPLTPAADLAVDEDRQSMATQRIQLPMWAVTMLTSLLAAGLAAAVTWGVHQARMDTVERDVTMAITRLDRYEATLSAYRESAARQGAQLDTALALLQEMRADSRTIRNEVSALSSALHSGRARTSR